MLGVRRADLRADLAARGVAWIDDPTNDDSSFDRIRARQTIAALDLRTEGAGYLAAAGQQLRARALDHGVFLRPLGSTVYVLPPYCITGDDLDRVWGVVADFAG